MGVSTRITLFCDKHCGRCISHLDDATLRETEDAARKTGWSCTKVGHVCPQCVESSAGVLHVAVIKLTFHPATHGTYPDGSTWVARAGHTYAIFRDGRKHYGGTYGNPDTDAAWKYVKQMAAREGYTHYTVLGSDTPLLPLT